MFAGFTLSRLLIFPPNGTIMFFILSSIIPTYVWLGDVGLPGNVSSLRVCTILIPASSAIWSMIRVEKTSEANIAETFSVLIWFINFAISSGDGD